MSNNDAEKLNTENTSVNQAPKYEADDGMITDEVIEIIKKIVPQVNFDSAESLF